MSLQYSQAPCILPVLELIFFMGCWFPLIVFIDARHLRISSLRAPLEPKGLLADADLLSLLGGPRSQPRALRQAHRCLAGRHEASPYRTWGALAGEEAPTQPHVIIPTRTCVCNAAPAPPVLPLTHHAPPPTPAALPMLFPLPGVVFSYLPLGSTRVMPKAAAAAP